MIAYGLLFCHGGEEDCGHCVGDSRRKQDQRKGHTGQDSVDRQGRTIIQPRKDGDDRGSVQIQYCEECLQEAGCR